MDDDYADECKNASNDTKTFLNGCLVHELFPYVLNNS